MPAMPRPKDKARKIAFDILGVPANMRSKRNEVQLKVNRRLVFEETNKVR